MIGQILGAATGGLLGGLANQKEGGRNAGNMFTGINESDLATIYKQAIDAQQTYGQDPTKEVQNNPILAQLFGKGGALERTNAEEQRLASQGFQLTPEDREAYGQASGDIARLFDESEQSLANALSARGLDTSGVAAQQFSGSQGNKREQLAKMQTDIAHKRAENNKARLADTRQFLSQLGSQGNDAINSEQNRGMQRVNQYNDVLGNRANLSMNWLQARQGQGNKALEQEMGSEHNSQFNNIASGMAGGAMSGAKMQGALGQQAASNNLMNAQTDYYKSQTPMR